MDWEPIRKTEALRVRPNLSDYARARREFSWAAARRELAGLPGGRGLNIAAPRPPASRPTASILCAWRN